MSVKRKKRNLLPTYLPTVEQGGASVQTENFLKYCSTDAEGAMISSELPSDDFIHAEIASK